MQTGKRFCKIAGLLAGLFLAAASSVNGAEFYVSPGGLDTNPGTIGAPFKTITRARDAVKTVNSAMTGDINVYLRGGWYMLAAPVTLDQSCSGTNGYNVVFQAYSNERPVLSGGKQITGWTLHDAAKNIWKAGANGVQDTRQLYVNCVRAVRAHSGAALPGAAITATGFTTSNTNMQTWANPTDIELVFNGMQHGVYIASLGYLEWIEARMAVSGINGTSISLANPSWDCIKILLQTPTDVENAYELLDQPGEWYLNRSQGVFYYKPKAGESMSTAVVIAPVLEQIVSIGGVLGSPARNIQFKGITFAHATWLRPNNSGFAEQQANYMPCVYNDFPGGNVVVKQAQAIQFERCIFKHLGGEGLELAGGSQNCVVTGCVFTDISSNCIRVGTVPDPDRTDTRLRDTGNRITNCYIHDAPCEYHGGIGIMAGYVADFQIVHNEIGNVAYSGISCGYGWGRNTSYMRDVTISHNYIHHFDQIMGDGGGIYSFSIQPNTKWHDNWLESMPAGKWGAPVYPDGGSTLIEIFHNVCSGIESWYWSNPNPPEVTYCHPRTITVHDNWSTTSYTRGNAGNDNIGTNLVIIPAARASWPQGAQDVANNAGIEPAYRDIKTLQCACSQLMDTTVVAMPAITPNGGSFPESVVVSLTCATLGATIRYTTNNSDPTAASTQYSVPFTLKSAATVKAKGFKTGLTESGVTSAGFTISTPLLLGHWRWDGNAADASANANQGTLLGNPVYVAGKFGSALSFDPTDGSADAVSLSGLAAYKAPLVSVSAWVKLTVTDTQGGEVVSMGDSYALRVLADGNVVFYFYDGTVWVYPQTTGINIKDGAWHHLVGQKTNVGVELYIDGALMNSSGSTAAIAYSLGTNLFIGRHGNGSTDYDFNGAIDDVRIYNYALSVAQIIALYNLAIGDDQRPTAGIGPGALLSITPSPVSSTCDIVVQQSDVTALNIYTLDNRLVRQLPVVRGSSRYVWDTRDNFGELVPNGIYTARIETETGHELRTMVIVR